MGTVTRLCAVLPLVACGRVGFGASADAGDAPADVAALPSDDAPGYRATAVHFESTGGDYLWSGFLANTQNSGKGTYSVWLHFTAGDGQQQLISVAMIIGVGGIVRTGANKLQIVLPDCAGIPLLDMASTGTYTTGSGWIHLLSAWDLAAGKAQLYIGDADDRAGNPGILSGGVCYGNATRWGVGGLAQGRLDADVADLYAALGTYLDISDSVVRRRFSDAAGKPIDLGTDCRGPAGAQPTACFTGDIATWAINKGNGNGMMIAGDGLTAAPGPSD
jgi:hypothetical protein